MRPKSSNNLPSRLTFDAAHIAVVHTYLSFAAFFGALIIGCVLHYRKIVKNGVAGYPQEWFPSVSATIGDWYPERNIFQILIALNSGPRFALVSLQYYIQRVAYPSSRLPGFLFFVGILRTLFCGGWVYITSTDDHDWHDILMITYIVCNLPWMFGNISATPIQNYTGQKRRKRIAAAFWLALVPMIYFFIQHKVHRIPGAYTYYSFFEWSLIILDILYDSVLASDLRIANLQISVGFLLESPAEREAKDITDENDENVVPEKRASIAIGDSSSRAAVVTKKVVHFADGKSSASLRSKLQSTTNFLSDLYLSFIHWSVFTSLTPTLFYFSVWELGIAGHELSLLSTLSPVLLLHPILLDVASSRAGRMVLHVLTLFGLLAYVSKSPLNRLFIVVFANAALSIGVAIDWSAPISNVGYQATLTGLGFLLSSISKHANHTNVPIWPIVNETSGGYNKTGIILACLTIYNYYTRDTSPEEVPSVQEIGPSKPSSPIPTRKHWIFNSMALGSLIFSLHSLIAESSTLIAWSWTGYPIKGPVPNLHGSLTHIAQAIGLLIPLILSGFTPNLDLLAHPLWFAYGGLSAYVLYSYSDWIGYLGGWNLAVFLMSIIPVILSRAAAGGSVAKTYATAMLLVALFYVGSVFTVAYAFVPGGQYFRERTHWVLAVQFFFLSTAFRWPRSALPSLIFTISPSMRTRSKATVAVLTVLSLLVTMYRWPTKIPQPHRPGPRILRTGIWTVHFGIDNEGRDSQRRIRDLVGDMQLDVFGLLETDLHRPVFGNRDLTRVIAEDLGYYVDIGPGPNKHTWGAVLFSKFPIINSTHHLLPSPDGELAPAIHAVLNMFGTPVNVVVVHNGQEETPLDRELQSRAVARIMAETYPQPFIFLGYVVTKPHAPPPAPYEILVNDGRMYDIDKEDRDRWCEYILYRGVYRTAYARVSRSTITDTELQIGQFQLPKHGTTVTDETEPARYLRAWKEELPPEHWFPDEYYPQRGGVRGHFYHVFNTPLYYKLPEGAVV